MLRNTMAVRWARMSLIRLQASSSPPVPPTAPQGVEEKEPVMPKLDAATIEKLKVAEDIGEKAFEENTEILKKIVFRGLRAMTVGILGFVAFALARRRKRRMDEASKVDTDTVDPTQRYLEEMRGLGFDVDGLEDDLVKEKSKKVSPGSEAK